MILIRDGFLIMGSEPALHGFIDVGPFGVMIHLSAHLCYFVHKLHGNIKVFKDVFLVQRVVVSNPPFGSIPFDFNLTNWLHCLFDPKPSILMQVSHVTIYPVLVALSIRDGIRVISIWRPGLVVVKCRKSPF